MLDLHKRRLILALALLSFAPSVHAGLVVNDTFTEAGDTNLESHTADSGGAWDESTAGGIVVVGATDLLRGNSASARRATNATSIGTPDIVVEADIAITSNAGQAEAGLYAREASASTFGDHYTCNLYDDTAGAGGQVDFGIGSRVASAEGTTSGGVDFNGDIGTAYHVRLQVVGPLVTCCVNHTTCVSDTSIELTTGNFVGVYTAESTSQTIDNFKAYSYTRGKITE